MLYHHWFWNINHKVYSIYRFTYNGNISPFEISYRSNYKFWFKCEYEGKTYSYQKIPNNLNSGKSILPIEIIRKIQPNSNIPCISYEISSGKITEYESVSLMNHDL